MLAEPLTAILLAIAFLDESLDPLGCVGVIVVLSGLVVVGRTAETTDHAGDQLDDRHPSVASPS